MPAAPCASIRRIIARESAAAWPVTVHVLTTARSACSARPTISWPAARNCPAMLSISAWFSRHPTVFRYTLIVEWSIRPAIIAGASAIGGNSGLPDDEIVEHDIRAGIIERAGQDTDFTLHQVLVLHACDLHTIHVPR